MPLGTTVQVLLWVHSSTMAQVDCVTLLVGIPENGSERLSWSETPLHMHERGFAGSIQGPNYPSAVFYLFKLRMSDGSIAYYVPGPDARSTAGWLAIPGFDGDFSDAGWHYSQRHENPNMAEAFSTIHRVPGFQVTFFDPAFKTPDWLPGSVMYQIFPDRFARGNDGIRKEGLEYHRRMGRPVNLHENWNEPPAWEGGEQYDPIDFFGGTLDGIRQKLPYLTSLGVRVLYLNPIFEARSNHRYDTATYENIDPLLGTREDFDALIKEASELGIRIILDAVLSHTGADSVYFNMLESYPDPGAAQGPESPYYAWYDFSHPNGPKALYRCWWGDPTLPEVDECNPSWQDYILGQPEKQHEGILQRWLDAGVSGYRLDVADEIPDGVLQRIRASVKGANPDAAVIGEVWEDATNKVSYGSWRNFGLGTSLDSVMNYPLRSALLGFATGTVDAQQLATLLKMQKSNYPAPLYHCLMNLMSSHDVERQRTVLALGTPIKQLARARQADVVAHITLEQDKRAARQQRLLAGILYGLPGVPCLYYGDERGLHGGGDPFCRATFPWSESERNDHGTDLASFYQRLGSLRRDTELLCKGELHCCSTDGDAICILRTLPESDGAMLIASNRSTNAYFVGLQGRDLGCDIDPQWHFRPCWVSDLDAIPAGADNKDGVLYISVPPLSTVYFKA